MFLTLQFPLLDYRYLKVEPNRIERPNWPEPGDDERLRYFGEIFSRNNPYLGPWDDEKKYCNARSVINFCGMEENHFFKNLHDGPSASRILFRRFQSDGKCMGKFEVGFNDSFEDQVAAGDFNAVGTAEAIMAHVRQYLLCPVKIKVGSRLSEFTPFIDSGDDMMAAYFWATQKGKKTFRSTEIYHEAESCEPVVLLHMDISKVDISGLNFQLVELPELPAEGIKLYAGFTTYVLKDRHYNLKTWIIATNSDTDKLGVSPNDFRNYNNTLRYLRINLLRTHVEVILQKKLLQALGRERAGKSLQDVATRERIYFYLHKIWLNLSRINRNKLSQTRLVQTAFDLDASYFGSYDLEGQIAELEEFKKWLQKDGINDKNGQVEKYVDESKAQLEKEKAEKKNQKTVFISYNHGDAETADLLKQKLEENNISVILDSASMKAGTKIYDFIISSIKTTDATLSLISVKSLSSGWVNIELAGSLKFKEFFEEKKFIGCYLDKDFFDDGFVDKIGDTIQDKLDALNPLFEKRRNRNMLTTDLDDSRTKLINLQHNLPPIVAYLRDVKNVDVRKEVFEQNFPEVLQSLKD